MLKFILYDYLGIEAIIHNEDNKESREEEFLDSVLNTRLQNATQSYWFYIEGFFDDEDADAKPCWGMGLHGTYLPSPSLTDFTQQVAEIHTCFSRRPTSMLVHHNKILQYHLILLASSVSDPKL